MSDIAIKVENISKLYQLGEVGTGTISHDLNRWWAKMRGKEDPFAKIGQANDRTRKAESDFVWALKDINFEVKKGDILGIIGRNGAGKSTLLKILSKITSPSTGKIHTKGRIASLLEVGTGFHPEMTGRENIYLNGSIMGMRKWEIDKKFDEIVDFAGVKAYIDTPVKRYSSGMYVRLAFAVAAFLEPEILIVDEVLAVGDAEFQKKCLGKIKDVSRNDGRTVLFVSHNLGALSQLCTSVMLLTNGMVASMGDISTTMDIYLRGIRSEVHFIERENNLSGNYFQYANFCDDSGESDNNFPYDKKIKLRVNVILNDCNKDLELSLRVQDNNKNPVFTINENFTKYFEGNKCAIMVTIPELFLTPGDYSFMMCINYPGVRNFDLHEDILPFTIIDTGSEFSRYVGHNYGKVFAKYSISKL